MLISFDKQHMEIKVQCGVLEDYKPSEEIKQLYQKAEDLKLKMETFMKEVLSPELKEIEARVKEINERYIEKPSQ